MLVKGPLEIPTVMGGNKPMPEVYPDSKVNGVNMGAIWGRQDPAGSHAGPMNPAIWVATLTQTA